MHICRKSKKPALSHKGPSARELCAQPQPIDRGTAASQNTKKESKKGKERKKMPGEWDGNVINDKYTQLEPMKPSECSALSCRKVTCSPSYGELLLCMRKEGGPLGFCFLLIWVLTDCLCPNANRISHASFPMVFCPILASWWMENRTGTGTRRSVPRVGETTGPVTATKFNLSWSSDPALGMWSGWEKGPF